MFKLSTPKRALVIASTAVLLLTTPMLVSGCAMDSATTQPALGFTLADEKAAADAEIAYNFIASTYVTLDSQGQLSPTLKAQLKPIAVQAYAVLKAVRAAYTAGDAATLEQKYQALLALKTEVQGLTQ